MALEFGRLSMITDKSTGSIEYWGGEVKVTVAAYLGEGSKFLRTIIEKIPVKWPDLEV